MALTDREIRKIEPGKALVKLSDGGGLQLWVMPDGAKRWRLSAVVTVAALRGRPLGPVWSRRVGAERPGLFDVKFAKGLVAGRGLETGNGT